MNIFAGNAEISDFMEPMLSEISAAAESEAKSPTQTRGSPVSDGKASRDVLTNQDYENFGWVRKNDVISTGYWRNFTENFAQAVEGLQKYPKNQSGEFMISVYDIYGASGVSDVVVFAKGTIESPVISKIVKFNLDNEADIYPKRRNLYEAERRGVWKEAGEIFNVYDKADFVGGFGNKRSSTQGNRDNNRFGVERGRSEIKANPIAKFHINEDENTITYTYSDGTEFTESLGKSKHSRELEFIDYVNEQAESVDTAQEARRPLSNRSLLANALMSVAQNDAEKEKLAEYKQKIAFIDSKQVKLDEIRAKIKELSFAKGPRDNEAITELRLRAEKLANSINYNDRQLLDLESTQALKGVIKREKYMAYNNARQKAAEAMHRNVEGRRKTEFRHRIQFFRSPY